VLGNEHGASISIIAPIVGGLGTLFGPILGAFRHRPDQTSCRADLAQSFSVNGLNLLIYGVLLMTVIKIAPQGCWPWLGHSAPSGGQNRKQGGAGHEQP